MMENKILINDKESLIGGLKLDEFLILDSRATFIKNITAKKLYIRDSIFICITDSTIDQLDLINCQDCLISNNTIKKINIDNKLPKFKGWFSKRRNRLFRCKYGSINNTVMGNNVLEEMDIV